MNTFPNTKIQIVSIKSFRKQLAYRKWNNIFNKSLNFLNSYVICSVSEGALFTFFGAGINRLKILS